MQAGQGSQPPGPSSGHLGRRYAALALPQLILLPCLVESWLLETQGPFFSGLQKLNIKKPLQTE